MTEHGYAKFAKESAFGVAPTGDVAIAFARQGISRQNPRPGTVEYTFTCPNCGGTVSTYGAAREQIEGGLRFLSASCSGCDATYTVEMTKKPDEDS